MVNVVVPERDLDWEGEWSSATSYVRGDVVYREGSSYRATQATQGHDPVLGTGHWELVALRGEPGPQGEQGPQGEAGSAPQAYHHEQGIPSDSWLIVHNLGYNPNVTAHDSGGTQIEGAIEYIDPASLYYHLNHPVGGTADCS